MHRYWRRCPLHEVWVRALAGADCVPVVTLPDGSVTTEVPDDAVAVTLAPGTLHTAPLGRRLDTGVGLGSGIVAPDTAATTDDARPTVQVLWPEGCP